MMPSQKDFYEGINLAMLKHDDDGKGNKGYG